MDGIPIPLIIIIVFFAIVVIGIFATGLMTFLNAGKKDASDRRRRLNAHEKDPMDPEL